MPLVDNQDPKVHGVEFGHAPAAITARRLRLDRGHDYRRQAHEGMRVGPVFRHFDLSIQPGNALDFVLGLIDEFRSMRQNERPRRLHPPNDFRKHDGFT
jgi:hypothetical protein